MKKIGVDYIVCEGASAVLAGVFFCVWALQAAAGPVPMPMEVHLDDARQVVVGEINHIDPVEDRWSDGVHCGRATIVVRETLKGPPSEIAKCLVVTGIDSNYGGSRVLRVRRVGDSGIWVIEANGDLSLSFGVIPEKRKMDVQRILKALGERKWSEPVNGLRAWAAVVHPDYCKTPVIIFAVNNASDADLFIPVAETGGIVSATVTDRDGHASECVFRDPAKDNEAVFCRNLSPGQTVYLHPDYSFIDLSRRLELLAGEYRVVVTCKNGRDGKASKGAGVTESVVAWKGEVKAPAVDLVLGSAVTKKKESQPTATTDAEKAHR